MPKLKIIKLKDIRSFLKRLPRLLGEKAFVAFLGLFILSLVFGWLVYYRYTTLIEKTEPETIEEQLKFKSKTYQEIIKTWQEREQRFKQVDSKENPNLFVP